MRQKFFESATDKTKQVDLDVDSISVTRVITMPDRDGTLFDAASTVIEPAIGGVTATEVRAALIELLKKVKDLAAIQGQYVGSSATMARLNAIVHEAGDWSILSADDGTDQKGIYVGDGTTFSLAAELTDMVVDGRIVGEVATFAAMPPANVNANNYVILTAIDGTHQPGLYMSDGVNWSIVLIGLTANGSQSRYKLFNGEASETFDGAENEIMHYSNLHGSANVVISHPTIRFSRNAGGFDPMFGFNKLVITPHSSVICVLSGGLVFTLGITGTINYAA